MGGEASTWIVVEGGGETMETPGFVEECRRRGVRCFVYHRDLSSRVVEPGRLSEEDLKDALMVYCFCGGGVLLVYGAGLGAARYKTSGMVLVRAGGVEDWLGS